MMFAMLRSAVPLPDHSVCTFFFIINSSHQVIGGARMAVSDGEKFGMRW